MRKKILWAVLVLVLVVLGTAAWFLYKQPAVKFNGERTVSAAPASFSLRFSVLNTAEVQTLAFKEGDALHVSWLIESGSVDILISMAGEKPIYQANGQGKGDEAAFDLPIPKSGDYIISVTGKSARGWMKCTEAEEGLT
ncbi:MAG: hypothetical protein IJJ60_08390 [Clostridia bacterium]|nr:hypothetical protein [Clostridia bacterium]